MGSGFYGSDEDIVEHAKVQNLCSVVFRGKPKDLSVLAAIKIWLEAALAITASRSETSERNTADWTVDAESELLGMVLSASKKINSQNPSPILSPHCEVLLFSRLSTPDEEISGLFRTSRCLGVLIFELKTLGPRQRKTNGAFYSGASSKAWESGRTHKLI